MGFDFFSMLTIWAVGASILLVSIGLNLDAMRSLMNGISINENQLVSVAVHAFIFIFFLAVFLVPNMKNPLNDMIKKMFEFPMKIMKNFFS